ncbi:hypothetical protein OAN27_02770 [Pelagibacteraceae bacterium]|nr:hypothetical protein [Pelagibacteraceae bacterium]
MKLINLNKYFYFFIYLFISVTPLKTEEAIDIWKKEINKSTSKEKSISSDNLSIKNKNSKNELSKKIIQEKTISSSNILEESKSLLGIYDPEENNFKLNMWSNTDGKEIKKIFSRINKIKLSSVAEDIFIKTIMTHSFSPKSNLSEEEFIDLKINWLIQNKKDDLLEEFLNRNKEFKNKKKIISYLVDKNIAKAQLNEGCKKSEFISKEIRDSYLEKFKVYCLIFNNKKSEAQLNFDILKEQGLTDSFFESKINFLLGINEKPDNKIKDNNLLNFYLSSITVKNFSYEPNSKTNKFIWEYMNAANLVKLEDLQDKKKIKTLEAAAKIGTFDKLKIFEIYKKQSFELNKLINAEELYQSLDGIDSRALIYQKYLLSDNTEKKVKLLLLLKDLFKKDDLSNIYTVFMSDRLKELSLNEIPAAYEEIVAQNIFSEDEYFLGKIKYDDKVLHRSKILRYYTEEDTPSQKTQKDLNSVYKKIKKNKKYFFSAKDLVLIESLANDGFVTPKEINYKEFAKKYSVPESLKSLVDNREIGLLALKFVEIIGQDDVYNLDPETIYFITNILNKAELTRFRNKILITALPLRV